MFVLQVDDQVMLCLPCISFLSSKFLLEWKLQRIIKERRNHFLILMILAPTYLYWQQMQRQLNSFLCFRFRPTLSSFASIRLMIESIINIQLS